MYYLKMTRLAKTCHTLHQISDPSKQVVRDWQFNYAYFNLNFKKLIVAFKQYQLSKIWGFYIGTVDESCLLESCSVIRLVFPNLSKECLEILTQGQSVHLKRPEFLAKGYCENTLHLQSFLTGNHLRTYWYLLRVTEFIAI